VAYEAARAPHLPTYRAVATSKAGKSSSTALCAQVDELGEIQARLASHRADIAREEELKRLIRKLHGEASPTQAVRIAGAKFDAVLEPRQFETVIDVGELLKQVGRVPFLKLASVTLKAVSEFADAARRPELVGLVSSRTQTGSRKLVVVPRA
jgi:hypothetical protein